MIATADFAVQSPDKQLQLLVEARKKVPASREWAARMRRNLFAHLSLPEARFFLLALPERFYLWKDAPSQTPVPPNYEEDAQEVLRPYLEKIHIPLANLSENSFELLVQSWLEDLISSDREPPPAQQWLKESGLYDAIRNGSIRIQGSP